MRMMITVILAIVGFLLPSFWLTRKVKKRQEQIFIDLPDVLDLMTVCVEAGLSIDASMVTITPGSQSPEESPCQGDGVVLARRVPESRGPTP